jgi:hypothetical protein
MSPQTSITSTESQTIPEAAPDALLKDLRHVIDQARRSIASTVNAGLSLMYWHVGARICQEIPKNERAEYGKKIVATLWRQLTEDYGKGFLEKNLHRMIQFAEVFPDQEVVLSLTRQLSWSHFRLLLPIKDAIKRDFYAEMCRIEKWNVRTMNKKIDSMLFERTALSKRPELVAEAELDALRKEDLLTPDMVFRDPYVLEFLKLDDRYIEKDLEDAIMRELEQFLLSCSSKTDDYRRHRLSPRPPLFPSQVKAIGCHRIKARRFQT